MGVDDLTDSHVEPTATGLPGITATSSYELALFARLESGEVWAFGNNYPGVFGNGSENSSDAPVRIADGLYFSIIAAGGRNTCGVGANDGLLRCWGEADNGQLGPDQLEPEVWSPFLMPMPWETSQP